MRSPRESGILLHPTSLPGRFGIGELGPEAARFVDFLADARQTLWQVLPLGPTGYGDSPYQCFSAFAGNPLLISLDLLAADGLLISDDLAGAPPFPERQVDFAAVIAFKRPLLARAAARFREHAAAPDRRAFADYCDRQAGWLEDFALFMALKDAHGGVAWTEWAADAAARRPEALARWRQRLEAELHARRVEQFLFSRQWHSLRAQAHARGVRLFGDVPIFVAHDSADVWAHPELFHLDPQGRPTAVAGVPPDYFSATGQLWGNPLYRWDALARTGYRWWTWRLRAALELVDLVRLDHFRGFEAYWEVPAGEATAVKGRWIKGPGAALFQALQRELGEPLPIVAENLGVITPEVEALRRRFGLPGMAILQFAFGTDSQANDFLPHNHTRDLVVYTGTHDNDTIVGWWTSAGAGDSTRSARQVDDERDFCRRYLATDGREIHWDFVRAALGSVAQRAVVPAQDLLGLGSEARMNLPGRASDNWRWRLAPGQLTAEVSRRLRELTDVYARAPRREPAVVAR
jgi:4-alpha-glucanotransferase